MSDKLAAKIAAAKDSRVCWREWSVLWWAEADKLEADRDSLRARVERLRAHIFSIQAGHGNYLNICAEALAADDSAAKEGGG